jgi:hypothetical protein
MEMLVQLQEADLRIDRLQHFIAHYQDYVRELEEEKAELQRRAEEEKAALEALKKEKTKKELDLQAGEEHIKKCNGRLYAVKTNKEYEATLKEIEEQRQKNSQIETELLILYDRIDEEEKKFAEAGKRLEQEQKQNQVREKELAQKLERAKLRLTQEEKERAELVKTVKPDALELYQWLREKMGARVLARAVDEICQSCFRKLNSQMYNEVLTGEKLLTCPNCNRILVYRETEFLADEDSEF